MSFDPVSWLEEHAGVRLLPAPARTIRLAAAGGSDTLEEFCAAHQLSPSTFAWWTRKKSLPRPGRWIQLGRALELARRIRTEPGRPLDEIAREHGYRDHSAVTHAIRRNFGLSPVALQAETWPDSRLFRRWWSSRACARAHPRACNTGVKSEAKNEPKRLVPPSVSGSGFFGQRGTAGQSENQDAQGQG